MAVTVVVLSVSSVTPEGEDARELSLTLDTPRLVIGRGEGCEVRLPDPSVSHRHASIRQRGGEHVLVDEGSVNGTFMEQVRLPAQTPRVLRSGDRVRVGRVWLEVRFEAAVVKGSTAAAAKEVALALVARGLRAQGEEADPRVRVVGGPDVGKEIVVAEIGRRYVLGRSRDVDLPLEDKLASRRHVDVARKGDGLVVQDLGSTSGVFLDDVPIGAGEVAWRVGQELAFGENRLSYGYPAAEALAEIERSPEERMRPGEGSERPPAPDAPAATSDATAGPEAGTPTPEPASDAIERAPGGGVRKRSEGGWSLTDGAVALFALGVIVVSILGALWLFGRP